MKNKILQLAILLTACFCFGDANAQSAQEYVQQGPIEDAIIGGAVGHYDQREIYTIDEIITDFETEEEVINAGYGTEDLINYGIIEIPNNSSSTKSRDIYPNPARDQINIPLQFEGDFTIRLYDLSGRLYLQSVAVGTNFESLDIRDVPEGMYLLHIESDQSSVTHKLKVSR